MSNKSLASPTVAATFRAQSGQARTHSLVDLWSYGPGIPPRFFFYGHRNGGSSQEPCTEGLYLSWYVAMPARRAPQERDSFKLWCEKI